MSDYPIYQRQERRQQRTAKPTVVDWAGAMEKMTRSINEGIRLGLDINRSRENSLQSAQQIKESEARMAATNIELGMKSQEFDNKMAMDDMAEQIATKNFSIEMSAEKKAQDELTRKNVMSAEVLKSQSLAQQATSMDWVTKNPDKILAATKDRRDTQLAADATVNPWEKNTIWRDYDKRLRAQESALGIDIGEIASNLPAEQKGLQQSLAVFTKEGINFEIAKIQVPVQVQSAVGTEYTDLQAAMYDADPETRAKAAATLSTWNPEMSGKFDSTKTSTTTIWMPLDKAGTYLALGNDTAQLSKYDAKYGGDPSYQAWRKSLGIKEKPVTPVVATPPPPIPPTPGVLSGKNVVAKGGLEMKAPSLTFAKTRTAVAEGDRIMAESPMEIARANTPRDQLANTAETINNNPDMRAAQYKYYKDQVVQMTADFPGQSTEQKAVTSWVINQSNRQIVKMQKQWGIVDPVATPDANAKDVATKVTGAALPVYTPEKAKALPKGTRYKGTDGLIHVNN